MKIRNQILRKKQNLGKFTLMNLKMTFILHV
jgi:hypothetical protein